MEENLRLRFRRGDLWAILLVAIAAVLVMLAFLPGDDASGGATVQIYHEGRLVREMSLFADEEFVVCGEYSSTIAVSGGRAAIIASDCPGGDCMRSSWISEPGRSIVCLPNRLELRISGSSDVDFVVR